jgi:hypothetical protein
MKNGEIHDFLGGIEAHQISWNFLVKTSRIGARLANLEKSRCAALVTRQTCFSKRTQS